MVSMPQLKQMTRLSVVKSAQAAADWRGQADEQPEQLLHHLVDGRLARILEHQDKRLLGGVAEGVAPDGDVDVGVVRDELDRLLQAPQAAERAFHYQLQQLVLLLLVLGERVERMHDDLKQLHKGDDGCAEADGAQVLEHDGPERREEQRHAGPHPHLPHGPVCRVCVAVPPGDCGRH
eukprot:scaffold5340_cov131-Isochrysis_galbana.AAC.12